MFEPGKTSLEQLQDIGALDIATRPAYYAGYGNFTPAFVGTADHRSFQQVCAISQNIFQFRRIDILAARNHHVLLALIYVIVAILILVTDVAGMEPAVRIGFAGGLFIAPICLKQVLAQ